jgi:hypothetical protein
MKRMTRLQKAITTHVLLKKVPAHCCLDEARNIIPRRRIVAMS